MQIVDPFADERTMSEYLVKKQTDGHKLQHLAGWQIKLI